MLLFTPIRRATIPIQKAVSMAICTKRYSVGTAEKSRSDQAYIARTNELLQKTRPALPRFTIQGSNIKPILTPTQFYTELKDCIRNAKKSITLAALYLGHDETDLVTALSDALRSKPDLKLNLLLDSLRGTRNLGKGSSASLLLPLVNAYPNQVNISMYHTPDLSGLLKRIMPPRFNEGIGLMHMKVYAFDDTLIMSGANMSHDYFSDRQDRYIVFQNKDITDYYRDLVSTVSTFSYSLIDKDGSHSLDMKHNVPDPVLKSSEFKVFASRTMRKFLEKWSNTQQAPKDPSYDTTLYPLVQMGPLGLRQDEHVTLSILDHVLHTNDYEEPAKLFITSGYFNFEENYSHTIANAKLADVHLIAASPEANGFFNSAGISKYIPPAYTFIEKSFFSEVNAAGNADRIKIEEYLRKGWTYHAKGLWVYPPSSDLPVLTTIGSPNFGYRSIARDLEAQLFLVTSNNQLRKSLHEELETLRQYSYPVTDNTFKSPDRQVPLWVGLASRAIRTML